MKTKRFFVGFSAAVLCLGGTILLAAPQSDKIDKTDQKAVTSSRDTVAKPMTEKQRKKQEDKLRKELETPYKKWLNEDVAYIITDEERKAFKQSQHRRRTRAVHRAVLAAARSHARHRRERI